MTKEYRNSGKTTNMKPA